MCLCGIKVTTDDEEIIAIEPDRENPFSWRDFCRKGKTAGDVRNHPLRIRTPMKRVGDTYVPATYEEALADISTKLNAIIDKHGADAVGTYHGNPLGFSFSNSIFFGGLLDALGTGNRYWVGSIDENNQHVVQEEMFGSELISIPPDIDKSKCFLLIGMDPVQSKFGWMEVIPDGWNRVLKAQENGSDLIIVDPRLSDSAKCADTHIAIIPGQDWAFLLALLNVIFTEGLEAKSTTVPLTGVEALKSLALSTPMEALATRCGISPAQITDVARRFATASSAVCVLHTGVSHTTSGTIAEWLGQALNAITNRLDTPGGKRFEKSYVDLASVFEKFAPPSKHRTRLQDKPTIAGFHSLAELADEIRTPGEGKIRAMIIAGGNPVTSGPDSNALDDAFSELEFSVAVDLVQRESHRRADWLIPGTHWLEREGLHVLTAALMDTPFAQYARQSVPPPAGIKEEWEFFIDLALAMKKPLFGKKGVNTIVSLSRKLAQWTGKKHLAMNPRWLEKLLVANGGRIKYKDILKHPHGFIYGKKEYGHLVSALRTPDKQVHCAPPKFLFECRRLLKTNTENTSKDFPYFID
jgi:formate dehydrogenase